MTLISCPPEYIAFANKLADTSGEIIRGYFRAPFAIEGKSDLSPVTVADRKAEKALRALIEEKYPEHGIYGEEYGSVRMESEFVWVLDPIDGTRAFVTGKPIFGTLISLMQNWVPVLGVIDQPIMKERWVGALGFPTKFNGKECKTRSCKKLNQAVLTIGHLPFPKERNEDLQFYRRLSKAVATEAVGGDCYAYAMLALGHCDIVVESELKLHDFAALVPIVNGAGGFMTDWKGKPLGLKSEGDVIAAGDRIIWQEAMELLS